MRFSTLNNARPGRVLLADRRCFVAGLVVYRFSGPVLAYFQGPSQQGDMDQEGDRNAKAKVGPSTRVRLITISMACKVSQDILELERSLGLFEKVLLSGHGGASEPRTQKLIVPNIEMFLRVCR